MNFRLLDRARNRVTDLRMRGLHPDEVIVAPEVYFDLVEEFNAFQNGFYPLPILHPRELINAILGVAVVVDPWKRDGYMSVSVGV